MIKECSKKTSSKEKEVVEWVNSSNNL